VFDNPNSSTARYMKELAGIEELPKEEVYSLRLIRML
jgi:phosphate transport system substrate-binding protein